jgi:hypothetical protein
VEEKQESAVTALLIIWLLLLVVAMPIGLMGVGMAGEGTGYNFSAYLYVITVLSYPAFLALAFFLRRKAPWLVLLPAIPVIVMALSIRYNW